MKTNARTKLALSLCVCIQVLKIIKFLSSLIPKMGLAPLVLFDAAPPAQSNISGGNGIPFDASWLSRHEGVPAMLAGGLTPETVRRAIQRSGAQAVDVSSGVEQQRGVKDPARIRAFLAAAKGVQS